MALIVSGIPPGAAAQTAAGAAYRINAGDVLRIEVTGRPELSVTVTVDDRGELSLPTIGALRGSGRTTNDLAADIARRVSLMQRETPQVRVTVVEARSQKIFVLGSVMLPDAYSFPSDPTVWEAISEAGGAAQDADLSAVEVLAGALPPGQVPVIVDVAAAIRSGAYDTLPRLKPGDTVRVPGKGPMAATSAAGSLIYIMGAVGAQGSHPLEAPGDLISTIIRSSPSADADLRHIEIVRRTGGQIIQMNVNARDYLAKAQTSGNPLLMPGDTIYIPRSQRGFGLWSILGVVSPVIGLITSVAFLTR